MPNRTGVEPSTDIGQRSGVNYVDARGPASQRPRANRGGIGEAAGQPGQTSPPAAAAAAAPQTPASTSPRRAAAAVRRDADSLLVKFGYLGKHGAEGVGVGNAS